MKQTLFPALVAAALALLPGCATLPSPEVAARNAAIAQEPAGDYFIGRRYYVESTKFWGWLRQPRQSWETARLVMMNEARCRTPDRVAEEPADGSPAHGFDHNREYRITGRYTGRAIYDPNSNLFLPEFELRSITLVNAAPGFLFRPDERYMDMAVSIYPRTGVPQM